jgi:redox-sensitive bicupin YhaK (pirin superfamily)
MITLRPSQERGDANHGWLHSKHTFSFAGYYDPRHMGFRSLRVINEDRVAAKGGFPTHPHQNMEIISYVVSGRLAHRDSMGNGTEIVPGDIQRMSAGTGIRHSEFNASTEETVHFLQIWILPERTGIEPSYEQIHFTTAQKQDRLCLLASRSGEDGSIRIHQDAKIFGSFLSKDQELHYTLAGGRGAWLQLVRGELLLNQERLQAGDGAAIENEENLHLRATQDAEFLFFDLA